MHQLIQNLKNGDMRVLEVPVPFPGKGHVVVRNHFSLISAGTEGKSVKDARASYIGKAKSRPEEVKKVIQAVKAQGLKTTYRLVMNKLEALSPLGYSCAGEVIGIGEGVQEFKVGDSVACGGSTANHGDVVVVPNNLCVPVPSGVDLKHASFTTLGAIALQGIRQAELSLGENCVVIGLGLVGRLTVQLLNAAGVQTIGIDVDSGQVEAAGKLGIHLALQRNEPGLEQIVLNNTGGYGTDAVIITAGTSSLDPVELAGALCRKKGKVVIVGAVPTGFSRPNYYKKELDLRMSSSYGPGRYDVNYEEKGLDYPIGYVRWTENRNMRAFLQLLSDEKINIEALITHEYPFEKATEAYLLILDKNVTYTGIVLKYDHNKKVSNSVQLKPARFFANEVNVGFIGAGSFAQNFLLPNLVKNVNLVGVATAHSSSARNVAEKFGFQYAAGNADKIINDKDINTIFIATRHNLHAENVLKALKSGKNVFVEKPLCLNLEELNEIQAVFSDNCKLSTDNCHLMVGFNRRFAPHIIKLKELLLDGPKAINYRINAGFIPSDHWAQDSDIGGGRIVGEVCHFVDLCMFIVDAKITSVSAEIMKTSNNLLDTLAVVLGFSNGSIANISYFSNGDKSAPKECLEVFYADQIAIIDDFKEMRIHGKIPLKMKLKKHDKGHSKEVECFINAIKKGLPTPISFEESYISTDVTFKIIDSYLNSKKISLNY